MAFLQDADWGIVCEFSAFSKASFVCSTYSCGFGLSKIVRDDAVVVGICFEATDDVEGTHGVAYRTVVTRCIFHTFGCPSKILFEVEAVALAICMFPPS